jgi:hypothetical protein
MSSFLFSNLSTYHFLSYFWTFKTKVKVPELVEGPIQLSILLYHA